MPSHAHQLYRTNLVLWFMEHGREPGVAEEAVVEASQAAPLGDQAQNVSSSCSEASRAYELTASVRPWPTGDSLLSNIYYSIGGGFVISVSRLGVSVSLR